jgi:hypothetical protein
MKKYFVIIIAILVSAFAFAQLKDVPMDHWAYESVETLVNDVKSVKTKSTFGVLLGVKGVGLSIVALLKAFGAF